MAKSIVPIFYACDDRFVKFTIVSIASMLENASPDYQYEIHVLHTDITTETMEKVYRLSRENATIQFDNVTDYLYSISEKLPLRDYYSKTTYYRLFIAEMFPQLKKAIYIDSDTVVCGNIAEFYNHDLGSCYVGACHEQAMVQTNEYGTYVEKCLGIDRNNYFNAGVILINCEQFRKQKILEQFTDLLHVYNFAVTQDEDYLNVICQNHVKFIDQRWNTEVFGNIPYPASEFKVIHYIMVSKPWHFSDCRYGDIFWHYAEMTEVIDDIRKILADYTDEQRKADMESCDRLMKLAVSETYREDNYLNRKKKERCSADRQRILEKIDQFEYEGRFDEDVEDDPPGRMIEPGEVDYQCKKLSSKILAKIAYAAGKRYLKKCLKNKQMIVKDIKGVENFAALSSGAIITCNHFNAMDSFAMQMAYMSSGHKKRKFFRIIREGNYTSFPGFFGFLMRHFYTLPLATNLQVKKDFIRSVDQLLRDGNFVLVYPEQSMWWNYRKPKPFKEGGFYMAAKNMVPVLPCFITMEDSDIMDENGFPVQEYTIHISKPIYPDPVKSLRSNTRMLMNENYEEWKEIYERTYHIPLTYETKKAN